MAVTVMKDLEVELDDRPGTLAAAGDALGRAGVNIEGLAGVPVGGRGLLHLLLADAAVARSPLESAGARPGSERDVLVVDVTDRPGELGSVTRRLADAGVNIELAYLATGTRLVLGVDDLGKARAALA